MECCCTEVLLEWSVVGVECCCGGVLLDWSVCCSRVSVAAGQSISSEQEGQEIRNDYFYCSRLNDGGDVEGN